MSPNEYKPKGSRPGQINRKGQGHQAKTGHLPPDRRGEIPKDQSGYLVPSSTYEPEHKYESLKGGNNKVYQEDDHYMEIVS